MVLIRKSIVGYAIISMLAIQTIMHTQSQSHLAMGAYTTGMNPGMQIRLEQKSLDALKMAMQRFFPHYFNADINFPREYEFDFGLYVDFLTWHFKWSNIQYTQAQLDIQDVKVLVTRGYDRGLLKVDLPLLENWEITAH